MHPDMRTSHAHERLRLPSHCKHADTQAIQRLQHYSHKVPSGAARS